MMARQKSSKDETALKQAVLDAALGHAPQDGFNDRTLAQAGAEAGAGAEMLLHLFPNGPASLIEFFSEQNDAEMGRLLAKEKLSGMKVRDRIAAAVLTRLEILKPRKEAARRAAAFLTLPVHAALGVRLLSRTVDAMWRAAGDTSTDFNFYTKRAILAGVYSTTLLRWFSDSSEDMGETRAFLAARIENVMQFEKFKAEMRERTKDLPSVADVLKRFSARHS
jgi:ubiquinone biosynthesis protein COQ9